MSGRASGAGSAGSASLRREAGQLIIAGLEGLQFTAMERAWWKLIQPGGVILFRRNIEEAEQASDVLKKAASHSRTTPLRCVDVEGGLVDRLRDLIAPMPAAADVAATGKAALCKKHGRLIGREARLLGFDTTLAPVLDLALPASASVMRSRVVAADANRVVAYAEGFLDGLEREGVLGCGKHFPGLGGGTLDSHASMPVIDRAWSEMWEADLLPYRRLARRLPMIMVSHAAYPRVEGKTLPASVSKFWIGDVLRRRIGYRGIVLSDDMEMGGITTQRSMAAAAVEAIAAGADMLEICKNPALVVEAYEALLTEAERSAAFRARVKQASGNVMRAKKRWGLGVQKKAPTRAQVEKLRGEILAFQDEVAHSRRGAQA